MKLQKRDGSDERQILIGMITDPQVLSAISIHWQGDMFRSKWCNLIGRWCTNYYSKYDKAPGQRITTLFERWSAKTKDDATRDLVETFLTGLSDEYEVSSPNSQFTIDLASGYFSRKRLEEYIQDIQSDLDDGKVDDARKRAEGFALPSIDIGTFVDPFHDEQAAQRAHATLSEPLIKYPKALGAFLSQAFERDAFVSFMGPEKRGKSFWLLDVVWRGVMQRRRVAYFEVGDMSEGQVIRRFHARAARRPVRQRPYNYPIELNAPTESGSEAGVELEARTVSSPMTWQQGHTAMLEEYKKARTNDSLLRLTCHPNSSVSAADIRNTLKSWARGGWVADLVVIDYADILAPMPSEYRMEGRDLVNATWKTLRRISQEFHCCVVTATQADAMSYSAGILGMQNFSEDKRKFSHVTGMIGINQTTTEKRMGVQRLNWLVLRDSEFHSLECVHVAGCFAIANPAIRSVHDFKK